ncbi:hypothetical protein [Burkholderia phage FLC9]|nr:hypothetical protein [Burkholderia phage FLC9]
MKHPMSIFMHTVFQDGTLAPVRTPDQLLDVLTRHSAVVEGTHAFLVTGQDELNELAPVELLAGQPFASRATMAQEIADGKHEGKPFVVLYSGPGFIKGVHASQQRLLNLPLEERAAKVIHAAEDWRVASD